MSSSSGIAPYGLKDWPSVSSSSTGRRRPLEGLALGVVLAGVGVLAGPVLAVHDSLLVSLFARLDRGRPAIVSARVIGWLAPVHV